jgi:hypothetical protein
MSGSGGASGSSPELLLLLESVSGSLGGGAVGNGCCSAASAGVVVGDGELGVVDVGAGVSGAVVAGLAASPGNGNCSATGFLGGCGVQGFVAWFGVWVVAGHGVVAGGFCGGAVWARLVAVKMQALRIARVVGWTAIRWLDDFLWRFVIVSKLGWFFNRFYWMEVVYG